MKSAILILPLFIFACTPVVNIPTVEVPKVNIPTINAPGSVSASVAPASSAANTNGLLNAKEQQFTTVMLFTSQQVVQNMQQNNQINQAFATARNMVPTGIPTGFGIKASGVNGFDYKNGWYYALNNTATREVKFRFEDEQGNAPDWDVTDFNNYGFGKQIAFPSNLKKFHTEVAMKASMGEDVTATLYGAVPQAPPKSTDWMAQEGKGVVLNAPQIGRIDYTVKAEARADNSEVKGDIRFTMTVDQAEYVGEGKIGLDGLQAATFTKQGQKYGEIRKNSAGKLEFVKGNEVRVLN